MYIIGRSDSGDYKAESHATTIASQNRRAM